VKHIDRASATLFKTCASGKHIKRAMIVFAKRTRGRQTDYLQIRLDDVLISSIQDGTSAGNRAPVEQITLTYQRIAETFLANSGVGDVPVQVGWNVTANRAG